MKVIQRGSLSLLTPDHNFDDMWQSDVLDLHSGINMDNTRSIILIYTIVHFPAFTCNVLCLYVTALF